MVTDYLKRNERLAPRALLGVAAFLAILTVAKLWDYHSTSAEAQSIVAKAVDQDKPDPELLKENLAGFKGIADAIKKKNLFVPVPPKKHPVSAVLGIMGNEALINDKWYKAGDKIGDARIVAIEPTQVKIEWDGKEKYFAPIASADGSSSGPPSGRRGSGRGAESAQPGPARVDVVQQGPGRGGFGNMSEEQRAEMRARMEGMRARFESMSPEEREAFRNEMRGRFGGGGPGGGRGGSNGGRVRR